MPLATVPFSGRRIADNTISREFGSRWCSAHSPSATRPGPLGARLTNQLRDSGYPLATAMCDVASALPCTIEVYPHPALLTLLGVSKRLPYKVTKSKRYWPELDSTARIARLLEQFRSIDGALRRFFGSTRITLPQASRIKHLATLKRYEDALDALVCSWPLRNWCPICLKRRDAVRR